MSLGEAELLLLLSCNSWGGGGGLICSASIEVAEAVDGLLLQMKTNSEFSFLTVCRSGPTIYFVGLPGLVKILLRLDQISSNWIL